MKGGKRRPGTEPGPCRHRRPRGTEDARSQPCLMRAEHGNPVGVRSRCDRSRRWRKRPCRPGFPLPFGRRPWLLGHPVPAGEFSSPRGRQTLAPCTATLRRRRSASFSACFQAWTVSRTINAVWQRGGLICPGGGLMQTILVRSVGRDELMRTTYDRLQDVAVPSL